MRLLQLNLQKKVKRQIYIKHSKEIEKEILGKSNFVLFVQAVWRIILGWSVGKIMIILSFRVNTAKNKNTDHQGKETYAMFGLPIQTENSAIIASLPFLFDIFELKQMIILEEK